MLFGRRRQRARVAGKEPTSRKQGVVKEERPPAEPPDREKLVDEYFRKTIEDSVLIQRDVLVDLYKGIEKVLKFAGGLLYTSAKNAGKLMSKRLIEQGILDYGNVADVMLKSFVVAGYAEELAVNTVEVKDGKTIIEVEGKRLLLGSRMKTRRHADQPLAGYMAGWLEAFYGRKVNAKEVACEARGDPSCRFRIEIHDARPELKKMEGARYVRSSLIKRSSSGSCA